MLYEAYDEIYGIFMHTDKKRPLSIVAHHDLEDYRYTSLEYQTISNYVFNRINKHFNISIIDYLELPISMHNNMIEIIKKYVSNEIDTTEDLLDELEQTAK